jgi:hypothetical protein
VFQLFRCSYFIEFTFLLMPNLASRALVVV